MRELGVALPQGVGRGRGGDVQLLGASGDEHLGDETGRHRPHPRHIQGGELGAFLYLHVQAVVKRQDGQAGLWREESSQCTGGIFL